MTALWAVLAVLFLLLVIWGAVAGARRSRRRGFDEPEAPPGPATTTARTVITRPTPARPPSGPGPPGDAVEVPEVAPEVAPATFRDRLGKARGLFAAYRGRSRRLLDAESWDELEEALIRADVGVSTTEALLDDLRRRAVARELTSVDDVVTALKADLVSILSEPGDPELAHHAVPDDLRTEAATTADGTPPARISRALRFDDEEGVTNVWLFVGVNGVGKTTTIGKVARQETAAGRSVLLAAGDTFRAAAGEQLARWAERTGTELVRGAEGGDPSAIVYDAVARATARHNDLVLADTAGRLHTKVNLVEELKKIRRVADRPPGRVTEVLLVLDATTGQNGLVQARQFLEAVDVTGVVLTKLDGTAKGGVVVAIQRELGLPVKLVGLGEGPDDLVAFDPEDFVEALIG
jgi:fused signal recognition particle receptor